MEIAAQTFDAYLEARAKMPGRLKRIGIAGETAFDFGGGVPLKFDTGKMRLHGICSSEAIDGSRERVIAKGLDVSRHRQNPIFTLNHNWKELDGQIGRCEIDNCYTVKPGAEPGNKTPFSAQFFQSGPNAKLAEHAFAAAESKAMQGISMGFFIKPHGAQKAMAPDGGPILDILQSELFEVTLVPLADNPDTIVRIVEKGFGGHSLHETLRNILLPSYEAAIAESKKTVAVGGYKSSSRAKAMNDTAAPAAAAPANVDPAAQQPMAPPEPMLPASAEMCAEMNTYYVGLLRCLSDHSKMQEHPATRSSIPEQQLLISEAFRKNQETYAALTEQHPDLPVLPGAGSLAIKPPPAPMAPASPLDGLASAAANTQSVPPANAMPGDAMPMAPGAAGEAGADPMADAGANPELAFDDGYDADSFDDDDGDTDEVAGDGVIGSDADDDDANAAEEAADGNGVDSQDDDTFADFDGPAEDAPTKKDQKKDKKKDKKPAKFKSFAKAMGLRSLAVVAAFDEQINGNVRTKAMQTRADKICDKYFESFGRDLANTDAGQLLEAANFLARVGTVDKITPKGKAVAVRIGNTLREKAFGNKAPVTSTESTAPAKPEDVAALVAEAMAELNAPMKAMKNEIFKLTGVGG